MILTPPSYSGNWRLDERVSRLNTDLSDTRALFCGFSVVERHYRVEETFPEVRIQDREYPSPETGGIGFAYERTTRGHALCDHEIFGTWQEVLIWPWLQKRLL